MKEENEKKGLLGKLFSPRKTGKNSCCKFEIEEIREEDLEEKKDKNAVAKEDKTSFCN